MSAITAVTSMPADSASPSGMITTALPQVRLQASASGGGVKLTIIQKNEGGVWFRTKAVLDLDGGETGEVFHDNPFGSNAYHVLYERGGYAGSEAGTATCYIAGAAAPVSAGDLTVTNVIAAGDVTVGDDLAVTADATIGATLDVTGAATLGSTLAVTGVATLSAGASVAGSAPTAAADSVKIGVADINGATTAALKLNYEGGASLTSRVHGTGAAKEIVIAQDLADDATIALPAPASGKVGRLEINEITEWGLYSVQSDGTITKLDGSTNAVATDTDAKLCLFSSTGTPTLRNRLGSALPFVGRYLYF